MGLGRAIFMLSVLVPLSLAAPAQDAPSSYSIKQDEASTGTNIRRNRVTGGLPYDKSYAELTDAQRLQFRSLYEKLGDADEPPFPELGLGRVYDPISRGHKQRLEAGTLSLIAFIDERGDATRVEVLSSPSPEMSKLAALVAMTTRFKPAKCAGVPCPMGFPIRIRLVVEH